MKLTNNLAFDSMIEYYETKYNMKYREMHLKLLRRGYELGFDISLYADPRFGDSQLNIIFEGLYKGLDVALYADINMNSCQMGQLRDGLKDGLDMSICADAKYPWHIMGCVKECLLHNCDPEPFLDETLTIEQSLATLNKLVPNWIY